MAISVLEQMLIDTISPSSLFGDHRDGWLPVASNIECIFNNCYLFATFDVRMADGEFVQREGSRFSRSM